MVFRDFFSALPLVNQVNPYQFYIEGYTESLRLFSDVRVVLDEGWLSGVPLDLQDYFFRVNFPCYFIPIFSGNNCYGFVVKGFRKETPRFCTNMFLPGCERIKGGEVVVLVEGLKDAYTPLLLCKDLPAVVIPMLTAVPSKELLSFFKSMGCSVLYVPDNDGYRNDHKARFYELCGKVGIMGSVFEVSQVKDFGDFFSPVYRSAVLSEGKRLRETLKGLTTF